MQPEHLNDTLRLHSLWLAGDPEGEKADLSGANLSGANLRRVKMVRVDLRRANLREAILCQAVLDGSDLREADLCAADLCGAQLHRTDLRGANLCGADLRATELSRSMLAGANLCNTCLDPKAPIPHSHFCALGFDVRVIDGVTWVYGWRTAVSRWTGYTKTTQYVPGVTYCAGVFSRDKFTECHPGLYLGTRTFFTGNADYKGYGLVPCRTRAEDALIAGSKCRTRRLEILREYPPDELGEPSDA